MDSFLEDEIFFQMEPRPQRLIYNVPEFEEWENDAISGFYDYLAENEINLPKE